MDAAEHGGKLSPTDHAVEQLRQHHDLEQDAVGDGQCAYKTMALIQGVVKIFVMFLSLVIGHMVVTGWCLGPRIMTVRLSSSR
jgi:hypothetical protein